MDILHLIAKVALSILNFPALCVMTIAENKGKELSYVRLILLLPFSLIVYYTLWSWGFGAGE